ncbi:hypothetical protein PshuTeo2_03980 [Pseudomonas hunanensis]|nr:hypothetical protein [Pseudomonas hunanensis]MDY7070379.1 hypothetical protein [Pseudomonas hunanensis]
MASQAWPRCNKCRSELRSRCAARAALDLRPTTNLKAYTPNPPKMSAFFSRRRTQLSAEPVTPWLPAFVHGLSLTNKADNHGLTGLATLQQM